MRSKPLRAVKWLWTVAVIVAAAWYLDRQGQTIGAAIRSVSTSQLLGAALLITTGKLVLVDLVRRSIRTTGSGFSFRDVAYMTMISQPAKYLPGSVWHLVGRGGMYTERGMSVAESSRAIALEQAWLLASAFFFGGIVTWAGVSHELSMPRWLPARLTPYAALVLLVPVWLLTMHVSFTRFPGLTARRTPQEPVVLVGNQTLTWSLMGLSLWIVLPPEARPGTLLAAVGAFSLAWAAGYVAVFAPGGLGVREAALVATMSPVLASDQAAAAALVSRAVWTLTELVLGAAAYLLLRPRSREAPPPRRRTG